MFSFVKLEKKMWMTLRRSRFEKETQSTRSSHVSCYTRVVPADTYSIRAYIFFAVKEEFGLSLR